MKPSAIAISLLLAMLATRLRDRYQPGALKIIFWDVGQGDSALVQFPRGATMLIDAGRSASLGEKTLFPELARLGILKLDHGVLSHPDLDHGAGFLGLLPHIRFTKFWVGDSFIKERQRPPLLEELLRAMASRGVEVLSVASGRRESIDGVDVESFYTPAVDRNDRSLVLNLRWGKCRVLFTGDIQKRGEARFARQNFGRFTILKVAHHGSRTSSTEDFVRAVNPKLALVSVGRRNRYGHPALAALGNYLKSEIPVLRTDFHGYVEIKVTKDHFVCESALGPCGINRCDE